MQDEAGVELSGEEVMKEGLALLGDACCFLYEVETQEGIALAFMVDAALRYGLAIMKGQDPRLSEEFLCENLKQTLDENLSFDDK